MSRRPTTTATLALAAALAAAGVPAARAQTAQGTQSPRSAQAIADRVAAARDGALRLSYAARSGACGDGRNVVAFGRALYVFDSMESYGRWSGVRCVPGPASVTLTVRDRSVVGLRVRVGEATGTMPDASVTDLGAVPGAAAADYFLALAGRAEGAVANEAVLAAVLADSADVAPGLLRIARDDARPRTARRRATMWLGEVGGAGAVADLEALARSDATGDRTVRESALAALANAPGDAGAPSLVRFVRAGDGDPWLRKKAVFWLGQTGAPEARRTLRAIIDSTAAPEELRSAAIFALGHGDDVTADDLAYLERTYDRVDSPKLRDQILMAVTQQDRGGDGVRWALRRARDASQPLEARKKAAFWAGQGDAPTADLAALYRDVKEPALREHLLFVLSQRDDTAATDQLIAVARDDADPRMRRKAMFWLGQKQDPRVAAMIRDIVTH